MTTSHPRCTEAQYKQTLVERQKLAANISKAAENRVREFIARHKSDAGRLAK